MPDSLQPCYNYPQSRNNHFDFSLNAITEAGRTKLCTKTVLNNNFKWINKACEYFKCSTDGWPEPQAVPWLKKRTLNKTFDYDRKIIICTVPQHDCITTQCVCNFQRGIPVALQYWLPQRTLWLNHDQQNIMHHHNHKIRYWIVKLAVLFVDFCHL